MVSRFSVRFCQWRLRAFLVGCSPSNRNSSNVCVPQHDVFNDDASIRFTELHCGDPAVSSSVEPSGSSGDFSNGAESPAFYEWLKSLSAEDLTKLEFVHAEYLCWKIVENSNMPKFVSRRRWRKLMQLQNREDRILSLWRGWQLQKLSSERAAKLARSIAVASKQKPVTIDADETFEDRRDYLFAGSRSHHRRQVKDAVHAKLAMTWRCADTPNVVLDLSFLHLLNDMELRSALSQIFYCFDVNSKHALPFRLHMAGMSSSHPIFQKLTTLHECLPAMEKHYDYFINICERPFCELFPRDRLVYLSPDSPNTLTRFDADKVYVIGAITDIQTETSTLEHASSLGVETAKLSWDDYVAWYGGNNELPFNQVLAILLDLHYHGDVKSAILRRLPDKKTDVKEAKQTAAVKEGYKARMEHLKRVAELSFLCSNECVR